MTDRRRLQNLVVRSTLLLAAVAATIVFAGCATPWWE